jgi:hypothetical protein
MMGRPPARPPDLTRFSEFRSFSKARTRVFVLQEHGSNRVHYTMRDLPNR